MEHNMNSDSPRYAQLYKEDVQTDFEDELQSLVTELWGAPRSIDWEQEVDVPEAERRVLVDLATQFHFNNMSELALCGRILERDHLLESKMVTSIIAISKIRNISTWGTYLAHREAVADVPPPEKDYFGRLQEIDNTISLLLGMSVIGKVTWTALTDELHDLSDPVFQQILTEIQKQKEAKLQMTTDFLKTQIEKMGEEERETLRRDARYYRGHARETILYHNALLDGLGKDTQMIADHVEDMITQFYDEIGLHI